VLEGHRYLDPPLGHGRNFLWVETAGGQAPLGDGLQLLGHLLETVARHPALDEVDLVGAEESPLGFLDPGRHPESLHQAGQALVVFRSQGLPLALHVGLGGQ
jgi:hypothetical protein